MSPSLQAELLKQKEELIQCLQEQLIGGRLRQAEMEAHIRDMRNQLHEHEEVCVMVSVTFTKRMLLKQTCIIIRKKIILFRTRNG